MVDYGNTGGGRIRVLTGTQVGLAAGTQDGVKLGLVGSHFILTGGVQFLWCRCTALGNLIIIYN